MTNTQLIIKVVKYIFVKLAISERNDSSFQDCSQNLNKTSIQNTKVNVQDI